MTFASANTRLAYCRNSVLNVKALVGFQTEEGPVIVNSSGTFG